MSSDTNGTVRLLIICSLLCSTDLAGNDRDSTLFHPFPPKNAVETIFSGQLELSPTPCSALAPLTAISLQVAENQILWPDAW